MDVFHFKFVADINRYHWIKLSNGKLVCLSLNGALSHIRISKLENVCYRLTLMLYMITESECLYDYELEPKFCCKMLLNWGCVDITRIPIKQVCKYVIRIYCSKLPITRCLIGDL